MSNSVALGPNSTSTTVSNYCCLQSAGEDYMKYYRAIALVLGIICCIVMVAGFCSVTRTIRLVGNALYPPCGRKLGKDSGLGTKGDKFKLLDSNRSSFGRRRSQKKSRHVSLKSVATLLAALAGGPPTVNLAEVALPAPVTAGSHHRD